MSMRCHYLELEQVVIGPLKSPDIHLSNIYKKTKDYHTVSHPVGKIAEKAVCRSVFLQHRSIIENGRCLLQRRNSKTTL